MRAQGPRQIRCNDALHQGAFARHLTIHAIDLALILEDALRSFEEPRVSDYMVRNPLFAELWQPIGFIRQQMLANSFSFLPVLKGKNCSFADSVHDSRLPTEIRGEDGRHNQSYKKSVMTSVLKLPRRPTEDKAVTPSVAAGSGTDPSTTPEYEQCSRLVTRIQGGERSAMEELYSLLQGGLGRILSRDLGSDHGPDHVHDTFLDVVTAIQNGTLRDPGRLMGFAMTIGRRKACQTIRVRVHELTNREE